MEIENITIVDMIVQKATCTRRRLCGPAIVIAEINDPNSITIVILLSRNFVGHANNLNLIHI